MARMMLQTPVAVVYSIFVLLLLLQPTYSRYTTGDGREYNGFSTLSPRGSRPIPLDPMLKKNSQSPLAYLIKVMIGGKPFTLLFDTGSDPTWVVSSDADEDLKKGRQVYDVKREGGDCPPPERGEYKYTGGVVVKTELVDDTIALAQFTVNGFNFGAVYSYEGKKWQTKDGILGMEVGGSKSWLSRAQIANPPITSFVFDVQPQGKKQVTFYDSGEQPNIGKTTWLRRKALPDDDTRWTVGSISHGVVLVDTGRTFLALTTEGLSEYTSQIHGGTQNEDSGRLSVLCSEHLPDFQISFEVDDDSATDGKYTMPGSIFMGRAVRNSNNRCYLNIREYSFTILGLSFIDRYMITFDVTNRRIGVTERAA